MAAKNPLRKLVDTANRFGPKMASFIMTRAFCSKVKLAGTAGVEILQTDGKSVTFRLKNRKKVQNHIGSVHAAGMALLAESATGFITGINLPGDKLPLIKSMNIRYLTRAQGDMQAVAHLSDEQISAMMQQDKGEVNVAVKVTDATGTQTVDCEMIWAWIPKKRSA
ncbi:DUF4442 domain-containing protein [Aliiglaciecola sp. CAU 1673]|uniref:DUF4442 domain-containing protein n=1 Tax=Aliiglaciecola sp. CAU 1673 TaxID=3032595 RepID=UPI0023DAA29A|nr:DUF4442 domain-containing protein [Aliiglaciecola sp. CAU 1673]MDF2178715.1 DUF4442 domain-containing protein [Aliiglaciecola sp. CAU 1673]